ncbi:MAG: PQQ-dependent sugar dehydrogenase [Pseudomonadota bacterium]
MTRLAQLTATAASVGLMATASVTSALAQEALAPFTVKGSDGVELTATPLAEFSSPWAMEFLPDGRAVVTEKEGKVWLLDGAGKKKAEIANAPRVAARGQGGMGDFVIHPDFAETGAVYLSYVQRDDSDDSLSGAVVERATLSLEGDQPALKDREIIWKQSPKVRGNGHYGHRLAVGPDGHLFITAGDRQKFVPAQNMDMSLGKVLRLNPDGSVPEDNPFVGRGGVSAQVWTLGHRNPLGMDFDAKGRLWVHEMGPRDGDELNLIVRAENYGYPIVSNGKHYTGTEIPDHDDFPVYMQPGAYWVPAISPAGLAIYDGSLFKDWQGDGFIGGMSSTALIRVSFDDEKIDEYMSAGKERQKPGMAKEMARYSWDARIREVEEGPDGAIYVLEDGDRLIKLTPPAE